jgi:ammonia channel protein AmtB
VSALGAMLLFTNFLAFNAASVLHISQPGDVELVSKIIIISLLCACGCAIGCLTLSKLGAFNPTPFKGHGYWGFMHTCNCGLMGLVSLLPVVQSIFVSFNI